MIKRPVLMSRFRTGVLVRWLIGVVAALLLLVLIGHRDEFSAVLALRHANPEASAYMLAHERAANRAPRRQWADIEQMAPELLRAVVAAEDARFIAHWGVDFGEMLDAMRGNIQAGRIVRGASTITMQLARNLYLSGERSYVRKLREIVIAFMLEAVLSKTRILELYLNVAQWGRLDYGAQAAARHYFDTDVSALNRSQAIWLAAILPAPGYYDKHGTTPWLSQRQARIARMMPTIQVPTDTGDASGR